MKKISFCITCMNRLSHLQKTLERNIQDNFLIADVEFVVLDYNSKDGLDKWIYNYMHKYINMGILVYYKTAEPVHYLRSHSRNMAFRLARGTLVCNLDADNYLGKDFALFMINEFQSEKNIFYISNLLSRDVFGRVCLPKHHFMEINGYNEELVGYGLEDAELFSRLLDKGLKQKVFYQEEFYSALTHPDSDRISEEPQAANIDDIYLHYIDPYTTEILIFYKDLRCEHGIIVDNFDIYHNTNNYEFGIKYSMDERYRVIIKDNIWEKGEWTKIKNIVIKFGDREMSLIVEMNELHFDGATFYKIIEAKLKSKIILVITEALNFLKIQEFKICNKTTNPDGFGRGVVYKNFNFSQVINLE